MTDPVRPEDISDDVIRGESASDQDLAPKVDRWPELAPRLPIDDLKAAGKILEKLMVKYSNRLADSYTVWLELTKRAREEFIKVGIKAHVQIVARCMNEESRKVVDLVELTTERLGYVIRENEFIIPPGYICVAISPMIVLDDYETIDKKKSKAESAIEQREKRRDSGDSYMPTLKEAMSMQVGKRGK